MRPRGVTLVELLAAISILVIVTALAMPAVRNRLAGARMDAAQGQIEAAILTTRAEAMRLGSPIALGARANAGGEVDLLLTTLDRSESAIDDGSAGNRRHSAAPSKSPEVWATLSAGLKITDQPDAAISGATGTNAPRHPSQPKRSRSSSSSNQAAELRIAVFCPDGTAVSNGPVYLSDGETTLTVKVNQWIGGASFTPFSADSQESTDPVEDRPSPPDNSAPGTVGPKGATGATGGTGSTGVTR